MSDAVPQVIGNQISSTVGDLCRAGSKDEDCTGKTKEEMAGSDDNLRNPISEEAANITDSCVFSVEASTPSTSIVFTSPLTSRLEESSATAGDYYCEEDQTSDQQISTSQTDLWNTDMDYGFSKIKDVDSDHSSSVPPKDSVYPSCSTDSDENLVGLDICAQDVNYRTSYGAVSSAQPLSIIRNNSEERSVSISHTREEDETSGHRPISSDCVRIDSLEDTETYSETGASNTVELSSNSLSTEHFNTDSSSISKQRLEGDVIMQQDVIEEEAAVQKDFDSYISSDVKSPFRECGPVSESYETLSTKRSITQSTTQPMYVSSHNRVMGSDNNSANRCQLVTENSKAYQQFTSLDASNSIESYESINSAGNFNNGHAKGGDDCVDMCVEDSNYPTEISLSSYETEREVEFNQSKESYNSFEEDYRQNADGNNCGQSAELEGYTSSSVDQCHESSYEQEASDSGLCVGDGNMALYTYKQPSSGDIEEMDTDILYERDGASESLPNVYQSYEPDTVGAHYQETTFTGQDDSETVNYCVNSETSECEGTETQTHPSSCPVTEAVPDCEPSDSTATYLSTNGTGTEALPALSQDQDTNCSSTSTSSSASVVTSSQNTDDQSNGALRTGDQNFKASSVAQSIFNPYLPAGVNPSIYAGSSMIQGVPPQMMSSSTVHVAQHPGGATIMRHQSMSAGLAGGLAQATVMQRHAMPNGLQATSVVQQRMLTNGNQTMVVQQRTMTTGLGGMTQQTVVQQRMAVPNVAQAAALHANAMRQRAMASQQANMMRHRLVRADMMGAPIVPVHTLRGPALIQQRAAVGMVRGVRQSSVMQQLVRQRYLGGPVMPGRGNSHMVAGRPVRVKMTYPRESIVLEPIP